MFMPLHVGRKVKIYPIQEHELESLNDLSGNTTLWTSIGSSAVVVVIGCVWDMLQASQETPKPPFNQATLAFTILCAVIGVVSFIVAHNYNRRKKTRLEKILSECIYAVDESALKK